MQNFVNNRTIFLSQRGSNLNITPLCCCNQCPLSDHDSSNTDSGHNAMTSSSESFCSNSVDSDITPYCNINTPASSAIPTFTQTHITSEDPLESLERVTNDRTQLQLQVAHLESELQSLTNQLNSTKTLLERKEQQFERERCLLQRRILSLQQKPLEEPANSFSWSFSPRIESPKLLSTRSYSKEELEIASLRQQLVVLENFSMNISEETTILSQRYEESLHDLQTKFDREVVFLRTHLTESDISKRKFSFQKAKMEQQLNNERQLFANTLLLEKEKHLLEKNNLIHNYQSQLKKLRESL
ncbi:hypothetical protein P9112_005644 [Eukaryota sp. TZLM1-RC]